MGARWVTPSRGNARESATENIPPRGRRGARVKRWGKSPPLDRRRARHGKPRAEQGQIGEPTGPTPGSASDGGGLPGRPLEPAGNGAVRGMSATPLTRGTEFGLQLPRVSPSVRGAGRRPPAPRGLAPRAPRRERGHRPTLALRTRRPPVVGAGRRPPALRGLTPRAPVASAGTARRSLFVPAVHSSPRAGSRQLRDGVAAPGSVTGTGTIPSCLASRGRCRHRSGIAHESA